MAAEAAAFILHRGARRCHKNLLRASSSRTSGEAGLHTVGAISEITQDIWSLAGV